MLILLIAMFTFVVDVISPATPTPTAQIMVAWLLRGLLLACFLFLLRRVFMGAALRRLAPVPEKSLPYPGSRQLLTLICILLC